MRGKQYDIFISYRRSDGTHIARLFKSEFKNRGYRTFLDFDDLTDGKFDKRIENAILDAPVFLMILTPDYFARCVKKVETPDGKTVFKPDEEDWVRREIECALKNEKVIIPVNYAGNLNGIPDYLEPKLKREIGLHYFSTVYADAAFKVTFDKMIKDRVEKVIKIFPDNDPQPQPQQRPKPKPVQTDFNTEYNRCMTTEQYPEAFAACLNEAVVKGSIASIKSKADNAIEKLKGRILIPDCVAHVSYDWLIDRLSEKGYSPIKTHEDSISHKKIRFRISKAGSGISEVKIKFYVPLFSKFIVLLGFFILSFAVFLTLNQMFFENPRLVTWVHSGAHKPFFIFGIMIEAIYIVFFVNLIRFIIRFFKRKKKAIQDVAKICLEECER